MKKTLLLSLAAFLMGMAIPYAQAQDIADQPCDTQYWRQMSARAWMEAEREIMQNQNLIFKADSVLEYTCFDQFVSLAAWPGGNIFVHTDYFGTKIIQRGAAQAMETTLTAVVSDALTAYKDENFQHDFLGGRAGFMDIENKNSDFKAATTNQGYTCKTMSDVWAAAKCMNFIDNSRFEVTDGFYPFDPIKGYNGSEDVDGYSGGIQETRQFPDYMSCRIAGYSAGAPTSQNLGPSGTWDKQIYLATNDGDNLYDVKIPLRDIFKDIADKLEPGNCGPGVLTGVTVITKDGEEYDDGVCTNPGCSYTKTGTCTGIANINLEGTETYGTGSQNDFGVGTYNPNTGTGGF